MPPFSQAWGKSSENDLLLDEAWNELPDTTPPMLYAIKIGIFRALLPNILGDSYGWRGRINEELGTTSGPPLCSNEKRTQNIFHRQPQESFSRRITIH